MIEQKIHQVTNTDTHTYTPNLQKQMHTETHTNPLTHTYSSQEYSPQNGIAVTAGTIFKSKASMTQSGATVWTKLIPAGNLVSAHQWHVSTTDLWCVTGAQCVSGATNALVAPLNAMQQIPHTCKFDTNGLCVSGVTWLAVTRTPPICLKITGARCVDSVAMVAPLTHQAPVMHHRSVVRTCQWCAETKFPKVSNLHSARTIWHSSNWIAE